MVKRLIAQPRVQLISLGEAAQDTGVSERTIRRWIAQGRLKAYRAGPRLVRIAVEDLKSALQAIPATGPAASTAAVGNAEPLPKFASSRTAASQMTGASQLTDETWCLCALDQVAYRLLLLEYLLTLGCHHCGRAAAGTSRGGVHTPSRRRVRPTPTRR